MSNCHHRLVAVVASICAACCETSVLREYPSPDGRNKAVLFTVDCGATTGFNIQGSIIGAHDKVKERGNVFVADCGGTCPKLQASVRWLDAQRLEVSYEEGMRIFSQNPEHKGVHVDFVSRQDLSAFGEAISPDPAPK